ncbi:hypothetical protein N7492_002391 [Penicillium capsulatum]|uniref:PHD finger and BAH domain protein n=1 Tax=Penicillium capsulatum TaxID=69766 RepID=A0A9W9ILB4_9EURO|nr:hypothetical protein N7492_002391 [Penicillium capsulatum]
MTSSNSPEAVADPAGASAAAPYGTRSRGRNAPRPNYAEDRDIDMDFEANGAKPAKRNSGVGLNGSVNGSKSDSEKSSPTQPRKSLTNGAGIDSVPRESIPGTSSFSARPDEANGSGSLRKRKHPGSNPNATNGGHAAKRIFTTAPGDSEGGYFTNMVSFEAAGPYLKDGQLTSDDGTTLAVNDHVYLICEPPGEPYYLARIMEFLPSKTQEDGVIEALRVNWYYRPRDIQRHSPDTRFVYASMHSDTCPLSSLRGKCQIRHISEIEDLATYKKQRDSFWYDKMFDRYIHRLYDVIPTKEVINVPPNVKMVLDVRWKFILVEMGKGKELTGAVKTCKRCHLFAANSESVDCAVCHSTYHMHCVRPALTKKPARGFAWACAPCSRAQERKLEARNTPILGEARAEGDDEIMEEEEDEHHHLNGVANGTSASTPAAAEDSMPAAATAEQTAQAKMWPYRYLGIHCRVEDALDYDDRIYPRASSRLGPRHQAIVNAWPGRPVEYVKSLDMKKKAARATGGLNAKPKISQAAMEAAKNERANRPKWVQDEPPGYIQRGEDEPVTINGKQARTAELLFKMPTADQLPSRGEEDSAGAHLSSADREAFIDDYMRQAKELAPGLGVEKYSTNFLDKALQLLYSESFDVQTALAKLKKVNKYKDLKEPHLRPEELKAFEQGVAKYGSEWRNIMKHVKTVPIYSIVRFYYMWKKTPRGRQVWGNYEGRRGKKEVRRQSVISSKLVDDVADDHDDSAFDSEKAAAQKRGFQCKFCSTRGSRQWRRAPLVPPGTTVPSDPSAKKDKGPLLNVALCLRCALLWRKYGIQYEDVDELGKRIAASGNKSWRRRIDEEMLAQLILATETPFTINSTTAATAASMGISMESNPQLQHESKLDAKKKPRPENPSSATSTATSVEPMPKKKIGADKTTEGPPVVPDPPKAKILPCAICNQVEPTGDDHLSCRDCRLTVHRNCYGVRDTRAGHKWLCDMCSNDRSPSISTTYECVLCPVAWTEQDLMETTKNTSRKKSDRDREKERLEKEMVSEAIKLYRQRQEAVGKPVGPREPLKRTAGNNWAHVLCSLLTPEIKYGDAMELEPAEGFGSIPRDRWTTTCKLCKSNKGACVKCHSPGCHTHFHVGCAFQAKYRLGVEVTPAKKIPRKDVPVVRLGTEVGSAVPVIYCPHHSVSPTFHALGEMTSPDGLNALQIYAQNYKQADLTLTGTSRKAAYVQQSVLPPQHHGIQSGHRRTSTSGGSAGPKPISNQDGADEMDIDTEENAPPPPVSSSASHRRCVRCSTDCSPRWWPSGMVPMANGFNPASHSFHGGHPGHGTYANLKGNTLEQTYECHKCHLKHPSADPTPDPRPSPYPPAQRPMLPTPRHTFVPHSHPAPVPTSVPGRPMVAPSHPHPGISGYSAGSSAPSASPPQFPSNPSSGPITFSLPECGSTAPIASLSDPSEPIWPHPISFAASLTATTEVLRRFCVPPVVQATVNRSPQPSLSALNGGPPPRMYSVDRGLGAPSHSPPVVAARLDPRGPTPPSGPENTSPLLAGRPPSAGRHSGVNGTNAGSGASASPSLKNLLS